MVRAEARHGIRPADRVRDAHRDATARREEGGQLIVERRLLGSRSVSRSVSHGKVRIESMGITAPMPDSPLKSGKVG
jgi:hypothetical protein